MEDGSRQGSRGIHEAASLPAPHPMTEKERNKQRHTQGPKRKGSLRKGIFGMNMMRERHLSNSSTVQPIQVTRRPSNTGNEEAPEDFTYGSTSSSGGWKGSTAHESSLSRCGNPSAQVPEHLDLSTTDDDDDDDDDDDEEPTSLHQPAFDEHASLDLVTPDIPLFAASLQRRNTTHLSTAAAASRPTPGLSLDDEWDHGDTEWWGWVILLGTWLVFVVGMGSCLGIWSWAWDVGDTPYAPPDLEDDPTLPIAGYYPALMISTAIMAWIWVIAAWVGMKYFRHAKVMSDDG